MHECLGILLHEMVGVQHLRAIQAMVKRAGAALWHTADSHERRREFTARFVERTRSLPDNASLTGREESIHKVIKVRVILLDGFDRIQTHCLLYRLIISSR